MFARYGTEWKKIFWRFIFSRKNFSAFVFLNPCIYLNIFLNAYIYELER